MAPTPFTAAVLTITAAAGGFGGLRLWPGSRPQAAPATAGSGEQVLPPVGGEAVPKVADLAQAQVVGEALPAAAQVQGGRHAATSSEPREPEALKEQQDEAEQQSVQNQTAEVGQRLAEAATTTPWPAEGEMVTAEPRPTAGTEEEEEEKQELGPIGCAAAEEKDAVEEDKSGPERMEWLGIGLNETGLDAKFAAAIENMPDTELLNGSAGGAGDLLASISTAVSDAQDLLLDGFEELTGIPVPQQLRSSNSFAFALFLAVVMDVVLAVVVAASCQVLVRGAMGRKKAKRSTHGGTQATPDVGVADRS